jgi:RNA polymerase sigma-70 factor (ECF subfamily)
MRCVISSQTATPVCPSGVALSRHEPISRLRRRVLLSGARLSHTGALRHLHGMESAVSVSVESDAAARVETAFLANERRLGQFLLQMVRDRPLAEDLLQETFVAAFNARKKADEVENVDAWLFGIARHRALAALRRGRRMRRAIGRLGDRREPSQPHSDRAGEVMDVLGRVLSPDDRSLVVLRYVHDLDATQLAELTGRSSASIRKRLERACASLAREIER